MQMAKRKEAMDEKEILSVVAHELSLANSSVSTEPSLLKPLQYYLGLPNGTEVEGRSAITSTDVADAIEWIMPQVMKSFTQNNEVVHFDPLGPDDEIQAEIESEFVYDILMKQNDGFVLIHQFVKDALLQRNGIIKVYYEANEDVTVQSYTGLDDDQLAILVSQPNIEVIEHSLIPYVGHSVRIRITTNTGKICVDGVPLEEFRVNLQHPSINLDNARFTAHLVNKTLSDLREYGIDEDKLEHVAKSDLIRTAYRFNYQQEATIVPSTLSQDDANAQVEIGECYMKLDINNDGIAERVKVLVGGVQPPTILLTEPEELDESPWVACTAILMSHKFEGLSIFDRLKQIQDNKTAIIRNVMDNMYLQNNQRLVVVNGQVNVDDLLISRPGGIVRAQRLDAISPLPTPQVGDTAFQLLTYLDTIRAGRVGVSAEGNTAPQNIGERVGSEGIDQLMTAKEELVGLIVRVICETGIKPLCYKIRNLAVKHIDTIQDFKFRGQWVKVDPSKWPKRTSTTVRVGTGSGDMRSKITAIQTVQALQEKIFAIPGQALVNPSKAYAAIDDFCKFSGLNGASKYFIDPNSDAGKQAAQFAQQQLQSQQQQGLQAQQAQLQLEGQLAQSAVMTAKAQGDNVILKGQIEALKHQRDMEKQSQDAEISMLKHQLEQSKIIEQGHKEIAELQFQYDKLAADTAIALTKIEADSMTEQNANYEQNETMAEDSDDR